MAPVTFAFATLIVKEAYVSLLVAWLHSVGRAQLHSNVTADVILAHCETDVNVLQAVRRCSQNRHAGTQVKLVETCVPHPGLLHGHFVRAVEMHTMHARFLNTMGWLALFRRTEYEAILFMDADTLLMRPVDELFLDLGRTRRPPGEPGGELATAIGCVKVEPSEPCNSGVVLLQPRMAVWKHVEAVLHRVRDIGGFVLSDQDMFNGLFSGCRTPLPRLFNFAGVAPGEEVSAAVRVLHFQGWHGQNKPIDYLHGGKLRYDRRKPGWPVFRHFEENLRPLETCYNGMRTAKGNLPPLYPPDDTPAGQPEHAIQRAPNMDKKSIIIFRAARLRAIQGTHERSLCAVDPTVELPMPYNAELHKYTEQGDLRPQFLREREAARSARNRPPQ